MRAKYSLSFKFQWTHSVYTMSGASKYRQLLRSVKFAFKKDIYAINMAKIQLREEFLKNATVTDTKDLAALYKGVEEVDEMLRFNIAQGVLNERGNYEVSLSSQEHKTTVAAGQDAPHGVEIEAIDKSVHGNPNDVVVTTTRNTGVEKKRRFEVTIRHVVYYF